jgi:hypothetical protein
MKRDVLYVRTFEKESPIQVPSKQLQLYLRNSL